jgi:predicted metal-dependent hydrolase
VLRYVVYHECIHCLVPEGANGKHSAAFMEYEMAAPARDRANEWLTANNFPTLDITYEDPRALRAAGRAP